MGAKNKAKVFWTGTCNARKHGKVGYKSTSGFFFIGVPTPANRREKNTVGCMACKKEPSSGQKA